MAEQGHSEMRSVLFTDLVGSTELRVSMGEERADEFRRVHDQLLRSAVEDHGGEVVKGLGDGIMATFGSAADAACAAVAVQQAVDSHVRRTESPPFAVRVGVSAGDVSLDADDVFGVPVVEASRLCAAAAGGEILVAEIVRALARGRGGIVFEPMGDLELKGLPEPVAACRVPWEPLEDATVPGGTALDFPSLLSVAQATGYVGRETLLDQLETARAEAAATGCRVVLLAGEPGVGKTRTAAELARHAHAEGAVVLYGRCDEDLALSYQPFTEALDFYVQHTETPVLGRLPGELTRLVPQLRKMVPGVPAAVATDPRSEEHQLFEACASWLLELATGPEVVLVLDDLHWATKPSLQLLMHVLRAAMGAGRGPRLLVVGTYRDTDIDRRHPLSGVLADLRRLPIVDRFAVEGLDAGEVRALIEAAAGHELDDELRSMAGAVYDETEGNPFFVAEVLRHLVETGAVRRVEDRWVRGDIGELAVPEGIRDVIGRRLSRLSPEANELLTYASVIGRDVDVQLLATLSDATEDAMLDALDEAVRARLIDETGADRYRFSHALVRSTLYEELSATRRRRLHRRVAEALEKTRSDDVVALAHHYVEAGPEGGLMTQAVRYGLAAGEQALAARAVADAEMRFAQVLEVLEDLEQSDSAEHIAALCGLGEAQRDQADQRFRTTLLEAARRALDTGQLDLAVRAVLSNQRGLASTINSIDPERVTMAEALLAALPAERERDVALVQAYLAGELVFGGDHARHQAMADEAEATARRIGDRHLLASVLARTGLAVSTIERWQQSLVRGREAVALADEVGDPFLAFLSRWWLSAAYMTAGEFDALRTVTAELVETSAGASPTLQWLGKLATIRLLLFDGELDRAEAALSEVVAQGQAQNEPDVLVYWAALTASLEFQRGRGQFITDALVAFADQHPHAITWRGGHAIFLALGGRLDEAAAVVADYGLDPERQIDDPFPLHLQTELAYAAFCLGDRALAEQCARVLRRFRDCWGHYFFAVVSPANATLALCESLLGNHDEAVDLLTRVQDEVRAVGCRGLAHVERRFLADVLLDRDGPGDRERAMAELEQAVHDARAIGAEAYAEELEETMRLGRTSYLRRP